jgi:quercetin dioxygenase-like cupin family protein
METWHVLDLVLEAHHPQVLRSDAETRVVAIQLPAGEQLQEHQVHERSYLLVFDGEITITQESGSVSGGAGLMAHFEPNERRTVEAVTDARLVLLLAPWPGEGHPSRAVAG